MIPFLVDESLLLQYFQEHCQVTLETREYIPYDVEYHLLCREVVIFIQLWQGQLGVFPGLNDRGIFVECEFITLYYEFPLVGYDEITTTQHLDSIHHSHIHGVGERYSEVVSSDRHITILQFLGGYGFGGDTPYDNQRLVVF